MENTLNEVLRDESSSAAEGRARRALEEKAQQYVKAHRQRLDELTTEVIGEDPRASSGQKLLLSLAAHEAAIAERLQEIQVQLLFRVELLIESPASALKLTKVLKDVALLSSTVGARVESLLAASSVLAAQRDFAQVSAAERRLRVA
jgi:hypothetical protein